MNSQCSQTINVSFVLDQYGNRNQQTGTLSEIFPASTATNQITASGFTYDAAGRVTGGSWGSSTSRVLTWDPEGKLLGYHDSNTGATLSFSYDPFGRRIKAVQSGTTLDYWFYGAGAGDHPLAELAGSTWKTSVIAEGKVIGTTQGTTVTYLAMDHLNSTKQTIDTSGTVSSVETYYPYGEEGSSITAEYKFTNQIRDNHGLDHFWMRTYAPNLGRWLTPDQGNLAAVDLANPQSWNRYAYVGNQPSNSLDAVGLFKACPPETHWDGVVGGNCVPDFFICDYDFCADVIYAGWIFSPGPPPRPVVGGGGGGGGGNGIPVQRIFQRTFQCSSSASGGMNALENNFASFANNPAQGDFSTFSIFTPASVSPGRQIGINVGVQAFGHTIGYSDVSVAVQSTTANQLVFQSNPGHVLYPATVSFSASDAGNGSITFTTSVNGTTNGLWGTVQFYVLGGRAGETSTWNNLLNNVANFCNQPSHP